MLPSPLAQVPRNCKTACTPISYPYHPSEGREQAWHSCGDQSNPAHYTATTQLLSEPVHEYTKALALVCVPSLVRLGNVVHSVGHVQTDVPGSSRQWVPHARDQ
jgi:hypothetical protein